MMTWITYLQCSSISGTDLVLFSSRQSEPSSSLSENTDSWGWCEDTRNVVHSCLMSTGFEQFAGDGALVMAEPTSRLAVSSWALITSYYFRLISCSSICLSVSIRPSVRVSLCEFSVRLLCGSSRCVLGSYALEGSSKHPLFVRTHCICRVTKIILF